MYNGYSIGSITISCQKLKLLTMLSILFVAPKQKLFDLSFSCFVIFGKVKIFKASCIIDVLLNTKKPHMLCRSPLHTLEINNGHSREADSIAYTRWRKTNQRHNTICVGHHYTQANTNVMQISFTYSWNLKKNEGCFAKSYINIMKMKPSIDIY
jgi:hypothetical protein